MKNIFLLIGLICLGTQILRKNCSENFFWIHTHKVLQIVLITVLALDDNGHWSDSCGKFIVYCSLGTEKHASVESIQYLLACSHVLALLCLAQKNRQKMENNLRTTRELEKNTRIASTFLFVLCFSRSWRCLMSLSVYFCSVPVENPFIMYGDIGCVFFNVAKYLQALFCMLSSTLAIFLE